MAMTPYLTAEILRESWPEKKHEQCISDFGEKFPRGVYPSEGHLRDYPIHPKRLEAVAAHLGRKYLPPASYAELTEELALLEEQHTLSVRAICLKMIRMALRARVERDER